MVLVALCRVIGLYSQHGFRVKMVETDPEFKPIEMLAPTIAFNLCAQNEHIPTIEWYIWTIKDRVQSQ